MCWANCIFLLQAYIALRLKALASGCCLFVWKFEKESKANHPHTETCRNYRKLDIIQVSLYLLEEIRKTQYSPEALLSRWIFPSQVNTKMYWLTLSTGILKKYCINELQWRISFQVGMNIRNAWRLEKNKVLRDNNVLYYLEILDKPPSLALRFSFSMAKLGYYRDKHKG